MRIKVLFSLLVLGAAYANAQELPANAVPGKCYIKCITSTDIKEETETIEISPSYKKLRTVPATFKMVEEEVMVKEASVRKVVVPATYETITVDVSCEEANAKSGNGNMEANSKAVNYEVIPAQFGKESRTIETHPKYGKWEYTQLKECPSANKEDCVVACYVEYPSKSMDVSITTLISDATVREIPIPCTGYSYKKIIVKEPARVDEIPIPAEYATIKRKVIDQPSRVMEEIVPPVSKTITKTYRVDRNGNRLSGDGASSSEGGAGTTTVWEEVDCNIATGSNLLPIQYELNSALLTAESRSILDENLVNLMKSKGGLRIEIASHTDSRSDDNYNLALSQQRAQSVVNYLVSKGISRNRLVARGFGETKLKNNCSNGVECTEEEHHQNRRTEFRILR